MSLKIFGKDIIN